MIILGCETPPYIALVIPGRGTRGTALVTAVTRLKLCVAETVWKKNSLSNKRALLFACCYSLNGFESEN